VRISRISAFGQRSSCLPTAARRAPTLLSLQLQKFHDLECSIGFVRPGGPDGPRINIPHSPHFLSDSELRPLRSTIITRFDATTSPLRHPGRPGLSLAGFRLGSFSPPPRASRVNAPLLCPHASANTPVLLLGAFATRFPSRQRPSPNPNWLGSHIARFEACSAFSFHSGLCAR
jgi:hypothetical protein